MRHSRCGPDDVSAATSQLYCASFAAHSRHVNRALLGRLPIASSDLRASENWLQTIGIDNPDGVALVIAALWPNYGQEFQEIARGWRGRRGPVARLIQNLTQATTRGTI